MRVCFLKTLRMLRIFASRQHYRTQYFHLSHLDARMWAVYIRSGKYYQLDPLSISAGVLSKSWTLVLISMLWFVAIVLGRISTDVKKGA